MERNGNFEAFLPAGSYRASVSDKSGHPTSYVPTDVTVAQRPVTGVEFKVARFRVSGSVRCFSACEGVSVALQGKETKQTITEGGNKFAFQVGTVIRVFCGTRN